MAKYSSSNHYILILCGGTGPRLWPLSRASNPKQFLSLLAPESLLQQTIIRATKIVSPDHVFIISNAKYLPQLKKQTKDLISPQNILSEPDKKNTLQAISYACAHISRLHADAIITSMPSDHFITPVSKFSHDIKQSAVLAASTNSLVLIGVNPTSANPSYGYLQVSNTSGEYHKILHFIEKPDTTKAAKLITAKALWNSGIYTFSIPTFVSELKKLQPDYYRIYQKIADNIHKPEIISKMYHLANNLAIDTAISEKSNNLIALNASFNWSDVGEWRTVFLQLKKDKDTNAPLDTNTRFLSVNSHNCLVKSNPDKLIGLVGVSNLAIIDTPDGLLICDLNSSSQVRDLISLIVSDKLTQQYFLA